MNRNVLSDFERKLTEEEVREARKQSLEYCLDQENGNVQGIYYTVTTLMRVYRENLEIKYDERYSDGGR